MRRMSVSDTLMERVPFRRGDWSISVISAMLAAGGVQEGAVSTEKLCLQVFFSSCSGFKKRSAGLV